MTFYDKAEIVFSQLRADRDRLQNAFDKIRAEIADLYDADYDYKAVTEALQIIDKHTKGVSDAQEL